MHLMRGATFAISLSSDLCIVSTHTPYARWDTRFNTDHPAYFKGHPLSVSYVIVIESNGNQTAYFCDSVGHKVLPDFFRQIEQKQIIAPSEQAEIKTVEQKQQPIQSKEEKSVSVSERSPKERIFAEQVDNVLSGKENMNYSE